MSQHDHYISEIRKYFWTKCCHLFSIQLCTNLLLHVVFTWCTPNWRKHNFQERITQLNKTNGSASTAQTSLGSEVFKFMKQLLAAKQPRSEPLWLLHAGSHVGEVPGAEIETAERNGSEMALQTIWNDLPDETIYKSVLSFCKPLMTCIKAQGGHSNIRLINLFCAYCSLAS